MSNQEARVHIKTTADTSGASATNAALDQVKGHAGQAIGGMGSGMGMVDNIMGGMVGKLGALAAGFMSLRKAVDEINKSLAEWKQQELASIDMESALANAGELTDGFLLKLRELSSAYQQLTGIGDDVWQKQFAQLARFGMSASNVDDVAKALLNLTAIMDGNVEGAAMALQRALQGSFEMFGRYGIQIEKTGDDAKDLSTLFEKLADVGGGKLEARSQSLVVQEQRLKAATGDFREALVELFGIADARKFVVKALADAMQGAADAMGDADARATGLRNRMPELAGSADEVTRSIRAQAAEVGGLSKQYDELEKAQLKAAEAKLDRMAQQKSITPEEAQRRKAALRKDVELTDIERRRAALNEPVGKAESELAAAKTTMATAQGRYEYDREMYAADRDNEERAGAYAKAKRELEAAAKAVADLEAKVGALRKAAEIGSRALDYEKQAAIDTAETQVGKANQAEQARTAREQLEAAKREMEVAKAREKGLGDTPEALRIGQERSEAASAAAAFERFEATGEYSDGDRARRTSRSGAAGKAIRARLKKAMDDEAQDVVEAQHALNEMDLSLRTLIQGLTQKIQTLESQIKNANA